MLWQVSEQEGQAVSHIDWRTSRQTDQSVDDEPHRQNDSCKNQNKQN